jgi:iron(II)-dependent oxidoreductase
MPKKAIPEPRAEAEEVTVQLKPILGVRPAHYLTAIYSVAIALIVFFLLFFPGLKNRGQYLSIDASPGHATVKVDGKFAGSTPCTIFLKHGSRSIEISKPFFSPVLFTRPSRGRVFATLFVPDKAKFRTDLVVSDAVGLQAWALADFVKNPGIPQIISDAASAAGYGIIRSDLYAFLDKCMLYVTNEAQLRELILAYARAAAGKGPLTPTSYIDLIHDFVTVKQKYDTLPSWLLMILTRTSSNRVASSEWAKQYLAGYREAISKYYQPSSIGSPGGSGRSISSQGMVFRGIPAGELIMGKDDNLDSLGKSNDLLLAHPVGIDAFYMGETEVTNSQYLDFVAERPEWKPSNRSGLVAKGLVAETYLESWTGDAPSKGTDRLPVTSVSWFAASAFAEWLTSKIQASLPGYQARLPHESEWEWAARGGLRGMPYPLGGRPGAAVFFQKGVSGPAQVGASEPNGYGLRDMAGNVWEWCADTAVSSGYLLSSLDPRKSQSLERNLPAGPDKAVRGGAWSNPPEMVKVYTRGSQPSDWCTPFLGFRVVLARP